MERIYTTPNRQNGFNALPIAKQDRIIDRIGKEPDAVIAREEGVSDASVSRIRVRHGVRRYVGTRPPRPSSMDYFMRYAGKSETMEKLRAMRIRRLMGSKTLDEIAKEFGVSRAMVSTRTSAFMRYAGLPYHHKAKRVPRRLRMSATEAERQLDGIYMIFWNRSEELRDHIDNLKKWRYAQRVWQCAGSALQ